MEALNDPAIVTRAAAAAEGVARAHDVHGDAPVVVGNSNNVLVHLRPAPVVARVATLMSSVRPQGGSEALAREVAVCQYLADRGAAVIAPSRELPPGPHFEDGLWLTFWEHVEADESRAADLEEAAAALAELHAALRSCPLELPVFEPVKQELPRVLDALEASDADADDLALLREALEFVLASTSAEAPLQPVHGDSHSGNLLRTSRGLLWTDFEDTCVAAPAWDLACLCMPAAQFAEPVLSAYGGGVDEAALESYLDARAIHAAVWWCWLARREGMRADRAQFWLSWWRERLS